MTNLFKTICSLFAGSKDAENGQAESAVEPVSYKGYLIYVMPRAEGGQYRVAGIIEKPADNPEQAAQQHQFIRSDLCMDKQQAEQITLRKCQLFIDQIGDGMFV